MIRVQHLQTIYLKRASPSRCFVTFPKGRPMITRASGTPGTARTRYMRPAAWNMADFSWHAFAWWLQQLWMKHDETMPLFGKLFNKYLPLRASCSLGRVSAGRLLLGTQVALIAPLQIRRAMFLSIRIVRLLGRCKD